MAYLEKFAKDIKGFGAGGPQNGVWMGRNPPVKEARGSQQGESGVGWPPPPGRPNHWREGFDSPPPSPKHGAPSLNEQFRHVVTVCFTSAPHF